MSEKLSTKKLKVMIAEWLSKPEIRKELQHHSEIENPDEIRKSWDGNKDVTRLEYELDLWKAPKSIKTCAQFEEFIWNMWCDGEQWKRFEKRKLKEDWESYFYDDGCFAIDMLGEEKKDLIKQFIADPQLAEKCILRVFVPDNELANNYRLEVVTTPDDFEVVGWTVIVD